MPPAKLPESLNAIPKLPYRRLGNSGLRVSPFILGCAGYGSPEWADWAIPYEAAEPILKAAWDAGIQTFDTANVYSNGESEKILGRFIREHDIPRHQVVVMTKIHMLTDDRPEFGHSRIGRGLDVSTYRDFQNNYGLSRTAIFNQVEASLRRLQMDYIDLLQIHRLDREVDKKEIMVALHDLVKSGKVRYIGASSMRAVEFAELQHTATLNGLTRFISMQSYYNLLNREDDNELNFYARETGVGLMPWSPLARGALARLPPDPEYSSTLSRRQAMELEDPTYAITNVDRQVIRRVHEVAQKRGWTMAQVAFVWVKEKTTAPLVGVHSVDRLADYLEAARGDWKLTAEEEAYLEELYQPKKRVFNSA
ncbi:NADP-dependent oxidoreductase domain-containing protein [Aspergillus falconensis]